MRRQGGRHRTVGGNVLRAAVLGANDGLCSNLSLVMGVAGAALDSRGMLVAGVAGLLAGAFSMALGEWISVTSSRELATRELHFAAGDLEELGIDPAAPGGSASEAAAFSFVLFALGAAVPVLPFLVARGGTAMASSLVLSAAALFGTGAGITVFTGVSAWRSGIRQLLMGLTAAGVTFGIGKLIGIVVTG